ncbi:hypothetical protein PUN71_022145 [Arthrobacter sp. NQ7]|nr:hypothetical protein [Arthrobacter sp. NQ7]MDJ0459913.1 hypothetical protein [Arthrobacter sp. NQ7]
MMLQGRTAMSTGKGRKSERFDTVQAHYSRRRPRTDISSVFLSL